MMTMKTKRIASLLLSAALLLSLAVPAFAENPTHFDPRQYLTPARDLIEEVVAHKIDVVFGTAGHAND
jgi:fructose/tagatose bisphosphate aldolase